MGRPGTGMGGSHSVGGHSVGRSSGGHHVGGSSRPGMGSSMKSSSVRSSSINTHRTSVNSPKQSNHERFGSDLNSAMMGMMLANALSDSFDHDREDRHEDTYYESYKPKRQEPKKQQQRQDDSYTRQKEPEQHYSEVKAKPASQNRVRDVQPTYVYTERPVQVSQPVQTSSSYIQVASSSQTVHNNRPPESLHKNHDMQSKDPEKTDPFKILCLSCVGLFFVVLMICGFAMIFSSLGSKGLVSIKNRTKLEHPVAYDNDNIIDELGYIDDPSKLSTDLQNFYNTTGVLPYVVLKSYDESLTSDEEKTAYAEQYYDEHIKNEGSMLYMYFEEPNPDDVGYMSYVNGTAVASVMDAEAIDIFWSYLDTYWVDENLSMDEVFVKTFDQTAATIMTKSKTKEDVAFVKYFVIALVIIGVLIVILGLIWFKHQREKARETERILNTPLDHSDELLEQYSDHH